jgi:hypothetical protein
MMESEYDVKDIIVIDNGTDTVKIGVSGEDYPRVGLGKRTFELNRWSLTQCVAFPTFRTRTIVSTISLSCSLALR